MQEKTDFTIFVIPLAVLEKNSKEKFLFSQEKLYSSIPQIKTNYSKHNIPQIWGGGRWVESSEEFVNTRLEARKIFGSIQKILR